MAAWKLGAPADLTAEGFKGWGVKRTQAPNTFQFFRAGKWVVLGLGQDQLAQLPALLADAKKSGRPVAALTNDFLVVAADIPGLKPWLPIATKWPLPPIVATMSGRGRERADGGEVPLLGEDSVDVRAVETSDECHQRAADELHGGQGIAPLLGQVPGLSGAGLSPLPNQFVPGANQHEQCRMFFSVPVANAQMPFGRWRQSSQSSCSP